MSHSFPQSAGTSFQQNHLLRDDPNFQKVLVPELVKLWQLFDKYDYQLRIAGGAVRDLLLNKEPKDVDLATTATPTQMVQMFTDENIRMFNKNGESHGTVSIRIDDKANFEVTTLRIDEVTDGRHARVKFTTDWEQDAARRDLTINSMFLNRDGTLIDYFGGYDDVMKRRVRFVGEPSQRICEDYLRILRFFRFFGRVANEEDDLDVDTLQAIKNNVSGLGEISGERIWVEFRLILLGKQAPKLIRRMVECGVHEYIGLPSNLIHENNDFGLEELDKRWSTLSTLQPHQSTVLATLISNQEDVEKIHRRLKFSNEELRMLTFIVEHRKQFLSVEEISPYQNQILLQYGLPKIFQEELMKYFGRIDLLTAYREWTPPRFPLNGRHITSLGIRGPRVGIILSRLREIWLEGGTNANAEELLQEAVRQEIIPTQKNI